MQDRIAIIGAGMTGLTAARELSRRGIAVTVVDKGRGPGGRMSTRRDGALRFDHGAQYFTARDPGFLARTDEWIERNIVSRWDARIAVIDGADVRPDKGETRRYVGVGGMNAVCRDLADNLDCRFGFEVTNLERSRNRWTVTERNGDSLTADALIVSAPPVQTTTLVDDPAIGKTLTCADLRPCWALMAVFEEPVVDDWDAAFVNSGSLSWVASQGSKPGSPAAEAWVMHANREWSAIHMDANPAAVRDAMLAAFGDLPGVSLMPATAATTHRWRYSIAAAPLNVGCFNLAERRLVVAGDWCAGSRVEGAYLSGIAAARAILGE